MEDYAKRNNLTNIRHFTDDGVSGTIFDRKGFGAMIAEVEAGTISTIIVKDMSRFGSDYLKVSLYTDVLFKDKGVRFIAINNGIDSDKQEGKRVSPSVPYGYRCDPQDKQHLIVDGEAVAVVRRVYQMVIDGYGVNGIADILTADKVRIPAAYAK